MFLIKTLGEGGRVEGRMGGRAGGREEGGRKEVAIFLLCH